MSTAVSVLRVARRLRATALGLVIFAALTVGRAADSSLRDSLTPEEFERSGLSKLSPEELAYLSSRIQVVPVTAARTSAPVSVPAIPTTPPAPAPELRGEAAFGREQMAAERSVEKQQPIRIESRLTDRFHGWEGRTVFTLQNGQVWRQAEPTSFVADLDRPVVTIQKGLFGAYYLRVAGYGSQVKVLRVK